ncbi:CAMK protein kinase [Cladophialophora psammophila CBS 110553]|uniref:CAMK protein kinase n=1 Tax=Cladophialophora psammophila CBS 110553 TaxID=1182543 RepID=W9X636_9EURO|nr:CAMK protein kinase [Cladophialophora psammophila CBS 110553]EXJ72356.1 CAMK protein kinase [Cladophialophora psammophila CBS 110553]
MSILCASGVRRVGSSLSGSSRPNPAGTLIHKDQKGKILGRKKIYPNLEIVVGRDKNRCQYVLDDPYISKRHLRIYTVVYENDEPYEIDTLVYAEDLSQNGTYWNGSLIGKGNGGFLLSDKDVLRLSGQTHIIFTAVPGDAMNEAFDYTQETEMAKFRKDYVLTDRLLGAGAFGRVYMAVEQMARRQVACKVVDLRKLVPRSQRQFGRPENPAAADEVDSRVQMRKIKAWANQQKRDNALERKLRAYYREVEILGSISHPNIVGIEKVYITDNTIYIMQDLVTAGDLFSYIESKNGKLLEVEAAVIIRQILVALRFLHNKNIVHRDIKPDNVLMTSLAAGCRVVLTDFGAARRIESKLHRMSSIIGTREYAAPEILGYAQSNPKPEIPGYTRAVDMWAVGCVSVVLLTGGLAFCDPLTNTYSEKLARDCNLQFLRESKEWQAVRQRPREFVENLLVLEEDARMTAEEALDHSWFSNETHKNDFEDLYQRTIRHWQPRTPKSQVIEFQDKGSFRNMVRSLGLRDSAKRSNRKSHSPIEPPYKPFPKNMHHELSPKRDPTKRLSEEVLSAVEKWSPQSAEALRIRVKRLSSGSPLSASQSAGTGTTGISKNPRATSEPPENRLLIQSQRELTDADPRSSPKAAFSKEDRGFTPTRSGIDWASSRTPTTKHRGAVLGGRSRLPLSGISASPGRSTTDNFPGFGGVGADDIVPDSPTTKPLRNIENLNHRSSLPESNDDQPGPTFNNVGTPRRQGKLKRRVSTPLTTPKVKRKKRHESIFELAEDDGDSDDHVSSPLRSQRLPLVHRPKKSNAPSPGAETKPPPPPPPAKLYLPR